MASTQLRALPLPKVANNRAPRLHPRCRVEKLAYVRFDQDNGGILLDIGEGGLNFQGVAGLLEGELCQLKFTLPGSAASIEVNGQVVWSNSSRKGGGIRFVDSPERVQRLIREWIGDRVPLAEAFAAPALLRTEPAPLPTPVEFERRGRAEDRARPARSSPTISVIIAAILILVFAAAVLLGDSPLNHLSGLFRGMAGSHPSSAVPPPVAKAEAAGGFQVEVVDLNNRRWLLTNETDGSAEPRAQVRLANFQNAVLVHGVRPTSPADAPDAPVKGTVRVNATIGTDGIPREFRVLSGDARLSAAALGAIRLWRYRPAAVDGEPVESQTVITINF